MRQRPLYQRPQRVKVRGYVVEVYADALFLIGRDGEVIASRQSMAGICNLIRRLRRAERAAMQSPRSGDEDANLGLGDLDSSTDLSPPGRRPRPLR